MDMLAESGYKMTLSESSWMINKGNMKINCGCKYNKLYSLMVINLNATMNVAESSDLNLWHDQLGHMPQGGLDWLMAIDCIPKR